MAARKNCKHQGFAYTKIHHGRKIACIVCDLDGENHRKEYCRRCDMYEPRMDGKEYQVNANDFCSYGERRTE